MKTQERQIEYLNACQILDAEIIGLYYIGFYRVLYGIRVRAGRLYEQSCDIDICCGQSQYLNQIVKDLYIKKMKFNRQKRKPIFSGLLPWSEIKPIYNDLQFMAYLSKLAET